MPFHYTLTDRTISVLIDGEVHQADRSHPNWDEIKRAVTANDGDADELRRLMTPIEVVAEVLDAIEHDDIYVAHGAVWHGDEEIHSALADRLLDVLGAGLDVRPWLRFTENVYANPFTEAREELYEWLENSDLPITDDGCFIAYKMVRDDYMDQHSGTILNAVGTTVELPGGRGAVDNDRRKTCSYGLHFCSRKYLREYAQGHRVLLLKVNPTDVVAIPVDESVSKGRTWRYEVVGELPDHLAREWTTPVWNGPEDDEPDNDWDWDDDTDDEDWDDGGDGCFSSDDDKDVADPLASDLPTKATAVERPKSLIESVIQWFGS